MSFSILLAVFLLASGGAANGLCMYWVGGNVKPFANKLLVLIGLTVLVWSTGLAVCAVAANDAIGVVGRFLVPLGFGPFIGLMLHFVLVLTCGGRWTRKWWIYPLLYLPGLACVYAFSILPLMGQNPYIPEHTVLGWVNGSPTDAWDWFSYGYGTVFLAACLLLLWRWTRTTASAKQRAQGKTLLSTLGIAALLGFAADVLPAITNERISNMASLFFLLPIIAAGRIVEQWEPKSLPSSGRRPTSLYSPGIRLHLNHGLGIAFAIGGVVIALVQNRVFQEPKWASITLLMAAYLLPAGLFFALCRPKIVGRFGDSLTAAATCYAIPAMVIPFYHYGSNAVWVAAFLFLIVWMPFYKPLMLISFAVSLLAAQFVAWAAAPNIVVRVGGADYAVRAGLLLLGASLCYLVNGMYARTIQKDSERIAAEKVILEISRDLVSAAQGNFEEKIGRMLELCGELLQCERAFFALLEQGTRSIRFSSQWRLGGAAAGTSELKEYLERIAPALIKRFDEDAVTLIEQPALPYGAAEGPGALRIVALPVKTQDSLIGFIGFVTKRSAARWNPSFLEYLGVLCDTLADAVTKVELEKEINFLAYHDQLTRLPNRYLFKDRLGQAIQLAKRMGKMVGVAFIDLDSFKTINDTLGHDLGDLLLIEVSKILSCAIRGYDTAARFGGDEFMLIINQLSDPKDILSVMDSVMAALRQPIALRDRECSITASAGVALFPNDGEDVETLIKSADIAMYGAKNLGKDRYAMSARWMHDAELKKLWSSHDLSRSPRKGR
ncbi:MAG: diguanylate cyclase [Bacillota bacterium]